MGKNNKKKYIFIIVIIFCLIMGAFKVREYYILKDCFVFSKDNIVTVWASKSGTYSYNYNYYISEEDVSCLSNLLINTKKEESSAEELPATDNMGSILLYLDGNIHEYKDDSISIEHKRSIFLSKINNEKIYVILQINKLRDDDSFNMNKIMQKFYIINSKELVNFIDKVDSN